MSKETFNVLDCFYHQSSRALAALVRKAADMTSTEAAKLPATGLDGDTSVTVHCGGYAEKWNSRYLCYHYYETAAWACDGSSEGSRYWDIVAGLEAGDEIPTDGIPIRRKVA